MIVKLPFGSETCAVDLRGLKVRPLTPSAPRGVLSVDRLIADAIDRPRRAPRLEELCSGRGSAVILVPDVTRAAQLPEILPLLLDRLRRGGIPPERTEVLVACGTHPAAGACADARLTGPLPDGVRCSEHLALETRGLVAVGTLSTGLDVRLNRAAVEAELLITVGSVGHHYFAGFGGGPKMVFPGVAGYEEIQANHSRVLRRLPGGGVERHPRCEPGVLDGNPVAQEIAEAAELRPPDFALCLVRGSDGRIAWAVAGPWRDAFAASVNRVREWYEIPIPEPSRLLVASAGGAPSDTTLIQAHKGLDAACRFASVGGEVLFVAELGGGSGSPEMEPFLNQPDPDAILARLEEGWIQYGHTTLRLVEKTARFRVHLVSRLDAALARRLGFEPVTDPSAVIERWREAFPGETVTVIPGGAVYPGTIPSES